MIPALQNFVKPFIIQSISQLDINLTDYKLIQNIKEDMKL